MSSTSPSSIFDDAAFEEPPKAYPNLKQHWLMLPLVLATYLVLLICLGIYIGMTHGTTDSANHLFGPFSTLVYVMVTIFAYSRKRKYEPGYVPSFRMPPAVVLVLLTGIVPALIVGFVTISAWFHLDAWNVLMHNQSQYYPDNLFVTISCSLVFTFTDQLLNRGILLDGLLKQYRPPVAILNSVLFISLLYVTPLVICFFLLLHLLYSWIYYYTRSLIPGLWAGVIYVVFSGITDTGPWPEMMKQGNVVLASGALVVLITCTLLLQKAVHPKNKQINK